MGDEEFNRAGDGTDSTLSNETLQRTSQGVFINVLWPQGRGGIILRIEDCIQTRHEEDGGMSSRARQVIYPVWVQADLLR